MGEPILNLTTAREPEKHVTIDGVAYPYAIGGLVAPDDMDTLTNVARWIGYAGRLLDGQDVAEKPADMPQTTAEVQEAFLRACHICLPDAPEDKLIGVGRDGMMQIIMAFFHSPGAPQSQRPSASRALTRQTTSPNSKRSTAATRTAGTR